MDLRCSGRPAGLCGRFIVWIMPLLAVGLRTAKRFLASGLLLPALAAAQSADISLRLSPGTEPDRVRIELSRPICEPVWRFAEGYPGDRSAAWGDIEGARWMEGALEADAGSCLSELALELPWDQPTVDRTYPVILGNPDTFAVYLPHLVPAGIAMVMVDAGAFCTERGSCADGRLYREDEWRDSEPYVVIGSFEQPSAGSRIRAQPGTPPWIVSALGQSADTAFRHAAAMYGALPHQGSLIHVFHDPRPDGTRWRGWSSGQMLFLVFSGQGWSSESEELGRELDAFLVHEILHLWNAWKYPAADGAPAWLTEGFAEFHTLAIGLGSGSISTHQAAERLLATAGRCLGRLPAQTSSRPAGIDRTPYDCGLLANWLVAERASGNGRSIADVWREVFTAPDGRHGVVDLAAAARSDGDTRWIREVLSPDQLEKVLGDLGYAVGRDPSSEGFRSKVRNAVYVGLLATACDGPPYGYYEHPDHVVFDTGRRCKWLDGDPKVTGFNGHDLQHGEPTAALVEARQACAGGQLSLDLLDGGQMTVPCKAKIPELVPPVTVTREGMPAIVERVMRAVR